MLQHTDTWLSAGLNPDIWHIVSQPGASALRPCLSGRRCQRSFAHKGQRPSQTNINKTNSTERFLRQSLGHFGDVPAEVIGLHSGAHHLHATPECGRLFHGLFQCPHSEFWIEATSAKQLILGQESILNPGRESQGRRAAPSRGHVQERLIWKRTWGPLCLQGKLIWKS